MLDEFTPAYIEAVLRSTPQGGLPPAKNYTAADIAPRTMKRMKQDCKDFQEDNKACLMWAGDAKQNGHDFWLTRNGHGTGFQDRGYGKDISDALCLQCKQYGGFDLKIGTDGLIYFRVRSPCQAPGTPIMA